MLERFITIKNVGRFRNCNARGDVTFRKLTLLFAENGRGKTTLCAILRSLQTDEREFILERKTLGTDGPPSVQVRLDGNTVMFQNNVWSSTYPDIAIFDSMFIHNNVYAGDYVDHEHKKNLYRVIVGARGVQLARQIEELDGKIRETNKVISSKRDTVLKALPNGVTLDTYLNWQPIQDIEARIQQKNSEIASCRLILDKTTEIQSKGLLAKIALPALPSDFLTVLSRQLMSTTGDAEAHVREQVAAHSMGNQGETWLSQGLAFVTNDKCPFCGQDITGNELVAAYSLLFSDAYRELKQEVAQLTQRIATSIGESVLNAVQWTLSGNQTLIEFWGQFAPMPVPFLAFEDIREKCASLRDLAYALAQRKQQSPTELVTPNGDFQAALDAVTDVQQSVRSYNNAVDTCNTLINAQKTMAQQRVDINALNDALADLVARRKRFEPEVVQACREYEDAVAVKSTLEGQKTRAKEQLDQYCEQMLQTYQQSINAYLDQFNTGFRIVNSRHLYTGGTPSSQYQIEIDGNAVDLGDSRTQPGTPCFKTALSSGDRSALALAFFLGALKQDNGISNKIVVLDDPFMSQDRFRRTCTQQLIRQFTGAAKQVIVLSHDPHFLRLIWEDYPPADIKVLQMRRAGDNTVIAEWDIEAETQSSYLRDYSVLVGFCQGRQEPPLKVVRSIRPFLEGLLRAHFPGQFQQNEWLGDFIVKIRNASTTDGLSHAKADLAEIEAINNYSKKYHHDQNPDSDFEPLSEDELHGYVKRTLRLAGG